MLPKSLRPLLPYMQKYRRSYALGALCVFFLNGIWILLPQVIGRAVDDLKLGVTREKLLLYALLILAVAFSKGIFQYLTRWVVIAVSREIEFDLRNDLFAHLERLSYSYYQRTRTGDIMARATNDLNAVRMLLGPAIMYSANTIVFTAGALAFMLHISAKLTLYAFLPLPFVSIVVQYFGRRIHERFETIQAMFSEISARAQENFSGARVIRAYVQEEAEIAGFESSNQRYIARSLKLVRLMGMLWPTLETMLGLANVLVLWLGGREVLYHRISVGNFVAFITYMALLTWPIIALGWVINIFQRGTASMGRINEILVERPEIEDGDALRAAMASSLPPQLAGEIEFRGLSFSYNGAPVLHDINLRIPAGSSLAIVGPTGSGKTTLVSLIPRIYDAAPGSVLLDGRPIREYPLEFLRRNIGFVPQETFLFSESVRENIAFGKEDASDEEVREAAEAANIAADIEGFPGRLSDPGGRTRDHTLRRTETAYRHRAGHHSQPTHSRAGRRTLQRGHAHRRQDPEPSARVDAGTHHDFHLPSRVHGAQRRPDCRAARRAHRRTGLPRRIAGAKWLLHRSLQQAVAGRRIGRSVRGLPHAGKKVTSPYRRRTSAGRR